MMPRWQALLQGLQTESEAGDVQSEAPAEALPPPQEGPPLPPPLEQDGVFLEFYMRGH